MRTKLLLLHQNLIYPAFLGVLLVNFTQVLLGIPASRLFEIDWLWLLLGAWFILYFCAAYLVLLEGRREDFGYWAFLANLVEVVVILFASMAIAQADPFGLKGAKPGSTPGWPTGDIEFWRIFASWLAIPITAAFANGFSERRIKTPLSVFVVVVAAIGLYLSLAGKSSRCSDLTLIGLMTIALIVYFVALATDHPWIGDFHPTTGFWTPARRREARVTAATDAAGRARAAATEADTAAQAAADARARADTAAQEARQAAEAAERDAAAARGH
jgi:hypothetical protein